MSVRSSTPYHALLADPDDPGVRAVWARLREASAGTTPFDALPYARSAADAFGLRLRLGLAFHDDRPAAGALLYIHADRREVIVPPLTPYTAVLAGKGWPAAEIHRHSSAVDALLEVVEAEYPAATLHLQPALTDTRPFDWRGWSVRPLYTYFVPLSADAPPPAGWSKNDRRLFLRQGDAARFVESPEVVETVLALSVASYGRHERRFPAPQDRVRLLVERLRAAGLLRAFTLAPPGADEPEAGVLLLQDGDSACYWMAGSKPGPAATLLLGHLLTRLCDEGVARLDFVGANTPSIAEFKRKFGSELATYYRVHRAVGLLPSLRALIRRLR